MSSDSTYYSSQDALRDRYLRKLEVLFACSKDLALPFKIVVAHLSGSRLYLNRGNSSRTMTVYLKEWRDGGYISMDDDNISLTGKGEDLLKAEANRLSKYLKPVNDLRINLKGQVQK